MLVTVFSPGSPLHDGAAILREEVVIAAGCILPLSSDPRAQTTLGTRHRAALGLSEETDAVVIVVSEQTGQISLAWRGALQPRLSEGELRSELSRIFRIRPEDEPAPGPAPEAEAPGGEKAAG
jgi:diadenylate cyclase